MNLNEARRMNHEAVRVIRREFRRSKEARYIHRLHGALLVEMGRSTVDAGRFLGVPQRTIAHWAKQFRKQGLAGVTEKNSAGRPPGLDSRQRKSLYSALKHSPTAAGLVGNTWTGTLVSEFLWKSFRLKLTVRHCRRMLRSFEGRMVGPS